MSKTDTAVKDEPVVEQETTPAEPAPAESNSPEVTEDDAFADLENDEESFDLDKLSDDEKETEEQAPVEEKPQTEKPVEETKPESQPRGKAEERKQQLKDEIDDLSKSTGVDPNTEIRDLVAKRNALRELEEARQREAQIASEQELLEEVNPETGEYYSPAEAERIARQKTLEEAGQTVAQTRYSLEVQQNQGIIQSEAQKALHDFPMFDSESPEFDENLTAQADQLLGQSLIIDQNGILVGSNVSPYQLYKTIHDSHQAAVIKGQANAQRSTEQMLANVDSPSGSSEATPTKSDPLLDGFDEEAARWTD